MGCPTGAAWAWELGEWWALTKATGSGQESAEELDSRSEEAWDSLKEGAWEAAKAAEWAWTKEAVLAPELEPEWDEASARVTVTA